MQRPWGHVSGMFKAQCGWSGSELQSSWGQRGKVWREDGPCGLFISVRWETTRRTWAEGRHDHDEVRCVERTLLIHSLQLLLLLLVPTRTAANFLRLLSRTFLNRTSGPPLSVMYLLIFNNRWTFPNSSCIHVQPPPLFWMILSFAISLHWVVLMMLLKWLHRQLWSTLVIRMLLCWVSY